MASIQNRIFLPVASILFLTGSITAFATYSFVRKSIGDLSSREASKLVTNVAGTINADSLSRVRKSVQEAAGNPEALARVLEMDDYRRIRLRLAEIKSFYGLKYLYTAMLSEKGEMIYLVDGFPLETDSEDVSLPGDVESGSYPDMIRSYREGRTLAGEYTEDETWGALISAYAPVKDSTGKVVAVIGADIDASTPSAGLKKFRLFAILILAGLTVTILGVIYFILKRVLHPLRDLTDAAKAIQSGNLRIQLSAKTTDETATLTTAFESMVGTLRESFEKMNETARTTRNLTESFRNQTQAIDTSGKRIAKVSAEVSTEATETARTTREASRIFNEITAGISDVSTSVQTISAEADSTWNRTTLGREKITKAISQMNRISSSVEKSVHLIEQLHSRSGEIGSMVGTISDISSRTNLLALNASIEAARAGEQGRGFAVVADEINKLAEQSSLSAGQIADLVREIQQQTEAIVHSMEEVRRDVDEGISVIHESGNLFEEIGSGSRNLSDGLVTLGGSSEEMSASVEEITSVVENINASMQAVRVEFMSVDESLSEQNEAIGRINRMSEELVEISLRIEEQLKQFQIQ